jgi:hypothetical protein
MTTQRALAVLILLTLVASLSLDVPAYQGKSKGKGKSEKSQGSDKKGGKSDGDEDGPGKGKGKSDSEEDESATPPLFKGKLGLRGSSQGKDQATLGFNGVEPNGSLQEAVIKAKPSADDERKAERVSALAVKPEALDAFIRRGKLNPELPEKKEKKDKKDSK